MHFTMENFMLYEYISQLNKTFFFLKDPVKRMKRQVTDWK